MIATVEIRHPHQAPVHVGPFPSEHAALTWLRGHPQLQGIRAGVHRLTGDRVAHVVILRSPESAVPEPSRGKEVTFR